MKQAEPDKYKSYMNRLKIENPDVYDKVKIIIGVDEEGPITFGENPLELKVSVQKKKSNVWVIVSIIIIAVVVFFLSAWMFSQ
jgi:hypothetical protein